MKTTKMTTTETCHYRDTKFCHGICGQAGVWASTGPVPTYPSCRNLLCVPWRLGRKTR